ncbi:thymidylate kinase-like [Petromyzon marinus]|uniref:thymidylate kinase-like n=1 Tax=Petromyzon marinus TaxID=7757 RepID=UPI003F723A8C
MSLRRGALLVLEGADRAGKSTQAALLVDHLLTRAGVSAQGMAFPDRTTHIGQLVSSYLQRNVELDDHVVHLLFSANRWERASLIREKLQAGVTLVVDRYAFSGVAFTAAKPGFDPEWCRHPDVGLPRPDLVLFLSVPPAHAQQRGRYGDERYEHAAFQQRVLQRYDELARDPTLTWEQVDGTGSPDEVHQRILPLATRAIQQAATNPILPLWA